jgi:hypothetical protein
VVLRENLAGVVEVVLGVSRADVALGWRVARG